MLGTNADEGTIFAPALALVVPNVTLPYSDNDIVLMIKHCYVSVVVVEREHVYFIISIVYYVVLTP